MNIKHVYMSHLIFLYTFCDLFYFQNSKYFGIIDDIILKSKIKLLCFFFFGLNKVTVFVDLYNSTHLFNVTESDFN